MKIGYFGTPSHSAKLLSALIGEGFQIEYVVTNVDKPRGRDRNPEPSPVKLVAQSNNLRLLQFESLKNDFVIETINSFKVDIIIVFAYGHIIPKKIFDIPPGKTINLHGSILPEYRGASPVQAAILNDKKVTGITLQYITDGLDAGNIISIEQTLINENDTFGSLLERLTEIGITKIIKLLRTFEGKPFPSVPQDEKNATYCKKIHSEDRRLKFDVSDKEIHNKVRAFNPGNICFTYFREKRLNIYKTRKSDLESTMEPGSFLILDKKTIGFVCGNGKVLILEEVQPENKKVMTGTDFLNGYRVTSGEILG